MGFIIYIYATKPSQVITYKMLVTKVDMSFEDSQSDIEFWTDKIEFNAGFEHNKYCRFHPVDLMDNASLSLFRLSEYGLKSAPQSGQKLTEQLIDYIESCFKQNDTPIHYADEMEADIEHHEGAITECKYRRRIRNREARNRCIDIKGCKCTVCNFDFEAVYGEFGKGFIHVHHITPMAEREGKYFVDIQDDLVPVCPNCHAMLHKRIDDRYLSIEDLSKIFNNDIIDNN